MKQQPTALITGANGGLGKATAQLLLANGYDVLLACRSATKGKLLLEELSHFGPGRARPVTLDLANLDDIKRVTTELCAEEAAINLLINNAAVLTPPLGYTKGGFESQFGVNHLGHFALAAGLKPLLVSTPNSRVVTVSSVVSRFVKIDFENLNAERSYRPWRAYAQSKLANLLFAAELQRLLPRGCFSTAVHPGYVSTPLTSHIPLAELGNKLLASTPGDAAKHVMFAATAAIPGGYFGPQFAGLRGRTGLLSPNPIVRDATTRKRLWQRSETLTDTQW